MIKFLLIIVVSMLIITNMAADTTICIISSEPSDGQDYGCEECTDDVTCKVKAANEGATVTKTGTCKAAKCKIPVACTEIDGVYAGENTKLACALCDYKENKKCKITTGTGDDTKHYTGTCDASSKCGTLTAKTCGNTEGVTVTTSVTATKFDCKTKGVDGKTDNKADATACDGDDGCTATICCKLHTKTCGNIEGAEPSSTEKKQFNCATQIKDTAHTDDATVCTTDNTCDVATCCMAPIACTEIADDLKDKETTLQCGDVICIAGIECKITAGTKTYNGKCSADTKNCENLSSSTALTTFILGLFLVLFY